LILKIKERDYEHIKQEKLFFENYKKKNGNLIVVLDKILDPQNFGSIIRSCLYYDVDSLCVNKKHRPEISPAVNQVSLGASECMDIYAIKALRPFLNSKLNQIILAASINGWIIISINIHKENLKNHPNVMSIPLDKLSDKINKQSNVIIVFGSEALGFDDNLHSFTNLNVYIPPNLDDSFINKGKFKFLDSMNVGVSAGIIINTIKNILI
jgi:21S rRNA (GM2251-2'-O)-methyltransferase